jgi:hypothetical protein
MVPRVRRPWARFETRCSTTRVVLVMKRGECSFGSSVSEAETTSVTQREAVWKGAWGIRPLGKGRPRRPATPVVRPRRNISQWNPAGLTSGNSVPWAIRAETCGGC